MNSLPDAIAQSNNFIRMEEDTKAIISKQNAAVKQAPAKPPTNVKNCVSILLAINPIQNGSFISSTKMIFQPQ